MKKLEINIPDSVKITPELIKRIQLASLPEITEHHALSICEKYFNKKINIKGFSNQNLEFLPVDKNKFSTLKLISKINSSKSGPIIINAANEIFVDEFLKHKITFNNISEYLNLVLKDKNYIKTSNMTSNSLKSIYKIDTWGRYLAHKIIKKRKQY